MSERGGIGTPPSLRARCHAFGQPQRARHVLSIAGISEIQAGTMLMKLATVLILSLNPLITAQIALLRRWWIGGSLHDSIQPGLDTPVYIYVCYLRTLGYGRSGQV